ncbi:MAG: response regulator [Chloroflexaceae bacterium]|nr:response regulator [Chloroflexaceae bacterium]
MKHVIAHWLSHHPIVSFRLSPEGYYTFINTAGSQGFHRATEDIVGLHLSDILNNETATQALALLDTIKQTNQPVHSELSVLDHDQLEIYSVVAAPVRGEDGQIQSVVGISRDITERKEMEDTLRQARDAADVANRAKSIFLARMSHELRTPLNAMLGFAQIMARDPHTPIHQREYLRIMNRSGEHLLTLINDILDMTRIEAGRIAMHEQTFDLYHLLDDVIDMFRLRAADKGLALRLVCDSVAPCLLETDQGKLRQVLINLLSNALKFTMSGSVTLRVSMQPIADGNRQSANPPTDSDASDTRQLLQCAVEDTGCGIAPHDLEHIFEPFTQTTRDRPVQEGTGLGLSISQRFVQLMGGTLCVSSEVGVGSCFTVTLPVRPIPSAALPIKASLRPVVALAAGQPQYRLLVVDDSADNRAWLMALLEPVGFAVRTAANGKEGIALWQTWQPHAIIMDMRMPVLDGLAATQHIKASPQGHATIIIALTASSIEEEHTTLLEAGCAAVLSQPVTIDHMLETLTSLLGVTALHDDIDALLVYQHGHRNDGYRDTVTIPSEQLRHLPYTVLMELNTATIMGDPALIQTAIRQIQAYDIHVAQALQRLATVFDYSTIRELIQPMLYAEEVGSSASE